MMRSCEPRDVSSQCRFTSSCVFVTRMKDILYLYSDVLVEQFYCSIMRCVRYEYDMKGSKGSWRISY